MAKTPSNHRQTWTPQGLRDFKTLIKQDTPTRLIAHKLRRTEAAIRAKASEENLSLKPTNQSPRNPKK